MTNMDKLLARAENGFDSLKVSPKYVDSAVKWLRTWLSDDAFSEYAAQIGHLIKTENWSFLLDSFYQVIPFGTGGRRGHGRLAASHGFRAGCARGNPDETP